MEKSTCFHKYTRIFNCDFCDQERTNTCYVLSNDSKIYDSETGLESAYSHNNYEDTLLICEDCFVPYNYYYDYNRYLSNYNKQLNILIRCFQTIV